jgi:DNA-binding MurR/RpiR family transcriptional regulator
MPDTAPLETYDDLRRAISDRYHGFSKRLQQIAQFTLEHPSEMALETIAVISERAGVQPSAMIRFAKALGYAGFSDMQRLFRERLAEGRPSYHERIDSLRKSMGGRADENPLLVLSAFTEANIVALNHLREEIDGATLQKAIDLMKAASQIYILAQRRAFSLATYMFYALNHLDLRTHLLDGVGGMLREQAAKIGPEDVLIVASFMNYSPEVVTITQECHRRGVPVVAITDRPLSPLVANSTVCFPVEDAAVHDFRSLNASMCLAQALAVSLGYQVQGSKGNGASRKPARTRRRN